MPPYRKLGSVPPKRHITHRQEPGFRGEGLYYEEVVTTAGFGRAYSVCYHLRPPTRVRKVEAAGSVPLAEPQHARQQAPKKLNHLSGILFTAHSIFRDVKFRDRM